MYPKTESEFFESSIHLIYAVIAAQGFLIAMKIFYPIGNLSSHLYLNNAIAITFAYFFLSTAWFGFFKSVKEFPHTKKRIAIPRYATGLFNSFILYYMISIASPDKITNYGDLIFLTFIFMTFLLVAHILKLYEYKNQKIPVQINDIERKNNHKYRIASTKHLQNTIIVTAFIFLVVFIFYQEHMINYEKASQWQIFGIHIWNPLWLGLTTAIMVWYRWHLWKKSRNYEATLDGISRRK